MNTTAAVALALASVVAYAAGAAVQHRVASRLAAKGVWWVAVALNGGGAALHVAALAYGPLTLVQPIGALTLVVGVPLGARAAGRRVTGGEWHGVALIVAGLCLLLPFTGGTGRLLGVPAALAVTAAACLVALPARGAVGYAVASGTAAAAGSALTQTVLHGGLTWPTVLIGTLTAGLAVGGLLLSQSAYTGGLGVPLAVLNLTNPIVSAIIGLTLMGERIPGGLTGAAVAAAGALLAVRGIILLSVRETSPRSRPTPGQAHEARRTSHHPAHS